MTSLGFPVWAFGTALYVVLILALVSEGRFMIRTTTALLANWLAHMLYWGVSHDPTPYFFSIGVDTLTAVIILTRPAGRMQAMIGWTLLVQIMVGFSYALAVKTGGYVVEAEHRYWLWLDTIAAIQILLVGGWWIGGLGRRFLGYHPDRGSAGDRGAPAPHDPASVG